MNKLIGVVGLVILIIAFASRPTKYGKFFPHIDLVATILLFINSIIIKSIPFILTNAFIIIILGFEVFNKKGTNRKNGKNG